MNFLPQRYRETQIDWNGKCGISWHITVIVRRVNGQLQTDIGAHITVVQSGKFHCHSSSGTCFAVSEDLQSRDPVRIPSTRQCVMLSQCNNYRRYTCHPVVIWCLCPCSRFFRSTGRTGSSRPHVSNL